MFAGTKTRPAMSKLYPKCRRLVASILILSILHMTGGCTFYRVKTRSAPDPAAITEQSLNTDKYIILHSGRGVWHMANIRLTEDETALSADLEDVSPEHLSYQSDLGRRGPIRYKPT